MSFHAKDYHRSAVAVAIPMQQNLMNIDFQNLFPELGNGLMKGFNHLAQGYQALKKPIDSTILNASILLYQGMAQLNNVISNSLETFVNSPKGRLTGLGALVLISSVACAAIPAPPSALTGNAIDAKADVLAQTLNSLKPGDVMDATAEPNCDLTILDGNVRLEPRIRGGNIIAMGTPREPVHVKGLFLVQGGAVTSYGPGVHGSYWFMFRLNGQTGYTSTDLSAVTYKKSGDCYKAIDHPVFGGISSAGPILIVGEDGRLIPVADATYMGPIDIGKK